LAQALLAKNLLITSAREPFRKNFTGYGAQYAIAGKFSLSAPAREAVALGSYAAYKKSQPRKSLWDLPNRLVVWSIVVALLSVAVTIYIWRTNGN
jgi:hypothetical protein